MDQIKGNIVKYQQRLPMKKQWTVLLLKTLIKEMEYTVQ